MPTPINIRTSPNFDGTMGTTSTEANPEVGQAIKTQAAQALQNAAPSASNFQIKFESDLEGVDPTSERAIYNHYGFVPFTATATTCSGKEISLNGQFNVAKGELQMVDIKR